MKRGDVVRVDWPFSDRTGSKVRPAVVVQSDMLNSLIDDTMLALITRTSRAPGVTEVAIDPNFEAASGLRFPSVASCNNILTVDQSLVVQTIGRLSAPVMQKIDECLNKAFGLP